ncbi:MAG: hypothetical protein K2X94_02100 [Amoebophilaceae bacterium]|nr:hypothetical protein [Amoebophilaceae bacterium]
MFIIHPRRLPYSAIAYFMLSFTISCAKTTYNATDKEQKKRVNDVACSWLDESNCCAGIDYTVDHKKR